MKYTYNCSRCPYGTNYRASFIAHLATCNGRKYVNWNTKILIVLIALFLGLYPFRPAQASGSCTIYAGRSGSVMLNVKSLPSNGWLSYYYYGKYKGRVNRVGIYTIGTPVAKEGSRHWSAGQNECTG